MLHLIKTILPYLKSSQRFLVAYSGGLDSHVLLHSLAALFPQQTHERLYAIHINHGWNPKAEEWGDHCQKICQQLNIPCQIIKIDAQAKNGESAEAYAREARYAAFAKALSPGDYLLTAHHQDDQAETLLLQLLRGAGVKGLASMPVIGPFARGHHLRPLLEFSRAQLEAYAERHQLQWIEDESNMDLRFDRNYIRQQLMPVIKQRWPAANKTIARAAEHCAQASELLDILAAEDFKSLPGGRPNTLSMKSLLHLSDNRRSNVLRYWFHQQGLAMPTKAQMLQIEKDVLHCSIDADPVVKWGDAEIRYYQDDLYVFKTAAAKKIPTTPLLWDLQQPLAIPDIGILSAIQKQGAGIRCNALINAQITVRFRAGGERFHPVGRQGSHPLKKLLQEWHIPTWERDYVPLIYCNDELIAVVGYAIGAAWIAQEDELGWDVRLIRQTD